MIKKIIMSLVFLFAFIVKAQYTQIYSMREAQAVLDMADENTLLLFDVDETLIMPFDKIILPHIGKSAGKSVYDAWYNRIPSREERERLWMAPLMQSNRKLVEPFIADLIRDLQKRNVKVLGLTRMRNGCHGPIKYLREYRFTQLFKFGIDFRSSFAQTIVFTECEKWDGYEYPMIHKGIIYCSEMAKGPILGFFLDRVGWVPNKVIFFDDAFDNIITVQQEMAKRDIEYHGFYYCAVEKNTGPLDCAVAKFQFDYLAEHEVWLGENDARRLMAH